MSSNNKIEFSDEMRDALLRNVYFHRAVEALCDAKNVRSPLELDAYYLTIILQFSKALERRDQEKIEELKRAKTL